MLLVDAHYSHSGSRSRCEFSSSVAPTSAIATVTPENFMAQMQAFPVALGVDKQGGCNFCHEADRSLDTKPTKVKARQMIEMVADINAKFGDGKIHVTCWTCHLGSTKPEIARTPKP